MGTTMIAEELIHLPADNTLIYAGTETKSGLYKILIPKGTRRWNIGVQTYRYEEPCTALLSFDNPPSGSGIPSEDTRKTLMELWQGKTLSFYSPEGSGTLMISQSEDNDSFRADRDRWLYIFIQFPAGRTRSWQSWIELYRDAVSVPVPDLALAQRTLGYAHEAGLVKALMLTANAKTDEELVNWVIAQGDLWYAICRLAGLAEQYKQ